MESLAKLIGERPRLAVAGRTDAGVHAEGQVVSFLTESLVAPDRIQRFLNGALAPEVVVKRTGYAPDGFDARFSASSRSYRYTIDTAELPDPFTARFVWHRPGGLRLAPMREAARQLEGEHDFASFCRHPGKGRSTVRNLLHLKVSSRGSHVVIRARADAFLHQMVRSLVGTLVAVGEDRIDAGALQTIIDARARSAAGPVAPARGLTLERVIYGRRVAPDRGATF